tara:strand:+ start:333 stop:854 length:522 start_codon:yes stop_codon:yes gene_type:complete
MINTLLTHGLTVILSLLCLFILAFIVGKIIAIIVNLLFDKQPIIGYPAGFGEIGGPTLLKVGSFLPIHLGHFAVAFSSTILYLPLILFLYQHVIDCLYVFDVIFMYSLTLWHALTTVKILFKVGPIRTINREQWELLIEEKSEAIGEIIGIIISFYFFGGKLAEVMCFSSFFV